MSRVVLVLTAATLFSIAPIITLSVSAPAAQPMMAKRGTVAPSESAIPNSVESNPPTQHQTPAGPTPQSVQTQHITATPIAHAASIAIYPKQLHIPSIQLKAPIMSVGVNAKGEMDVPSGNTNYIGWYKDGTLPGGVGAAVLDAHVFAAFQDLDNLRIGSDIYVVSDDNQRLHFKVRAMKTYLLAKVPAEKLFNGTGGRELNLITCAGKFLPAKNTYSHRLIVYATLIERLN